MKKFKGLIFAAIATGCAAAALAGCSSAETNIKTLCGENVTSICGSPHVYTCIIYTIDDEEGISSVFNCFDSVEFEKGESENFDLMQALTISIYGANKVTVYVAPDGAVSAIADDVAYYSDEGSADYSKLYFLLTGHTLSEN